MASDTSGSSEGWRVDTVNIAGLCIEAVSYADSYSAAYANSDSNGYSYSHCYAHWAAADDTGATTITSSQADAVGFSSQTSEVTGRSGILRGLLALTRRHVSW